MTLEEQIKNAETHISKMVFPELLNHHHTMFGGKIIAVMTEAGFITATRFSHDTFVIVSSDHIEFLQPIEEGAMIDVVGRVEKVGHSSIVIKVCIYQELQQVPDKVLAVQGLFKFVAIGLDKKSKPLSNPFT